MRHSARSLLSLIATPARTLSPDAHVHTRASCVHTPRSGSSVSSACRRRGSPALPTTTHPVSHRPLLWLPQQLLRAVPRVACRFLLTSRRSRRLARQTLRVGRLRLAGSHGRRCAVASWGLMASTPSCRSSPAGQATPLTPLFTCICAGSPAVAAIRVAIRTLRLLLGTVYFALLADGGVLGHVACMCACARSCMRVSVRTGRGMC